MRYNTSISCFIQYYTAGQYLYTMERYGADKTGSTSFEIDMAVAVQGAYAKICSGGIRLYTQSDGNDLYSIQIAASYGHSVLGFSPSFTISFPPTVGISFGIGVENLYNSIRTYKYDGKQL